MDGEHAKAVMLASNARSLGRHVCGIRICMHGPWGEALYGQANGEASHFVQMLSTQGQNVKLL